MTKLFILIQSFLVLCLMTSCAKVSEPTASTSVKLESEDVSEEGIVLPENRKQLLMHYMPWYTTPEIRNRWGSHWTGPKKQHDPDQLAEDGHPDIWSHFDPLIGPYDSADPDVLEYQLLLMKLAGVDGVIVDWYGIGKAADYPMIHEGTQNLFEKAGELGMSFAACYEDRTVQLKVERDKLSEDDIVIHLTETFQWMHDNWFKKDTYFMLDGRPLLLNFGPIYVKDPSVWDAALSTLKPRPSFFALHHLWQKAGADGGFTWVHQNAWEEPENAEKVSKNLNRTYRYYGKDPEVIIPSAYPGFKDVYKNPHPVLDHRDGKTMQESLAVCMEGPWKVIQLVTWNDYGEGTIIEPTHQFGYQFLEIIQEARRKELGDAFPFTAEDLRLPARLLSLRKAGEVPDESLDRIAKHLSQGQVSAASLLLAELEINL